MHRFLGGGALLPVQKIEHTNPDVAAVQIKQLTCNLKHSDPAY